MTTSTTLPFGSLFNAVETDIIITVAEKYSGQHKMEMEDLLNEAAIAVWQVKEAAKEKPAEQRPTKGYLYIVAENRVFQVFREYRAAKRCVLGKAASFDPEAIVGIDEEHNGADSFEAEALDRLNVNDHTEERLGATQLLRVLVREFECIPRGERYIRLLQDMLANEGVAEHTREAVEAREEILKNVGKRKDGRSPNVKATLPFGFLCRTHGLSQAQGYQFFDLVEKVMVDAGFAGTVEYIRRIRSGKEKQSKGKSCRVAADARK